MDKIFEQIFHHRKYEDSRQAHEKMLNILGKYKLKPQKDMSTHIFE